MRHTILPRFTLFLSHATCFYIQLIQPSLLSSHPSLSPNPNKTPPPLKDFQCPWQSQLQDCQRNWVTGSILLAKYAACFIPTCVAWPSILVQRAVAGAATPHRALEGRNRQVPTGTILYPLTNTKNSFKHVSGKGNFGSTFPRRSSQNEIAK